MTTNATALRTAPVATIFLKETKYEFLKLVRTRAFSTAVIGFPVMFYLLFGVANKHSYSDNVNIAKYMLGGYAVFGLVGAALFGIGVGLASERAAGWLEVKQASPSPPAAYLVAKCASAVAFGIMIVSILTVLGLTLGGVSLTLSEFAKMLGLTVAGSIAFASMGLLLALVVPANAATGIVNLIYLPMSFLSGLWIPVRLLPKWLQPVSPLLPTYHLSQLMEHVFGYEDAASMTSHWIGLVVFTVVMMGASWVIFSRLRQDA